MPIKKASIENLLRKGFLCGKALNTISETSREQCPRCSWHSTWQGQATRNFLKNILDYKVWDFMKYFVLSCQAEKVFLFGKYCGRISWKIFLERLFLDFKIFFNFWKYCVSRKYWGSNFWKNTTWLETVWIEKGIILSYRFYFLIAQAFLFFVEKYCVEFLFGFI